MQIISFSLQILTPKISLYTLASKRILETELGEVKRNSCIALSGKGGHSGLKPSRLCPDLTSGEL